MIRLFAKIALAAVAVTACNQTSPAPGDTPQSEETGGIDAPSQPATAVAAVSSNGYSERWQQIDFWSGEYPSAFAIAEEGVIIKGMPEIKRDGATTVSCAVPHKATYSPWNGDRVGSDGLEFVTMVFQAKIAINEDVEVPAYSSDMQATLSFKAGDELTYKTYLGEGFFIASKDGADYEFGQEDLPASTVYEDGPDDELWVRVLCDDDARAWVRYSDAMKTYGVEQYNYTAYAEASDLE
jgi:hypothetical protein